MHRAHKRTSAWLAIVGLSLVGAAAPACVAEPGGESDSPEAVAAAQQAVTSCVTIQRGQAAPYGTVADTHIALDTGDPLQPKSDKNFGASQGFTNSYIPGPAGTVYRFGLLRWDVSGLPSDAFITSATMRLQSQLFQDAPTEVFDVVAPWSESTTTWNNFFGGGNGWFNPGLGAISPVTIGATVTMDLMSSVSGWRTGANNGILLGADGYFSHATSGSVQFHASESLTPAARPALDICYVPGPHPVSCAAILAANPSAPDGAYILQPGSAPPIKTYCDMTNGGWTLVANAWIPSYAASVPSQYAGVGQFVLPHDIGLSFDRVHMECESTTTALDRTRYLASTSSDLDAVGGAVSETYGPTDNLVQPSSTACYQGYAEWHGLNGGCGGRFIIRKNQVHCGPDYEYLPGAETDNPDLGQYGRIWAL